MERRGQFPYQVYNRRTATTRYSSTWSLNHLPSICGQLEVNSTFSAPIIIHHHRCEASSSTAVKKNLMALPKFSLQELDILILVNSSLGIYLLIALLSIKRRFFVENYYCRCSDRGRISPSKIVDFTTRHIALSLKGV